MTGQPNTPAHDAGRRIRGAADTDVERLLALARDRSVAGREALAATVASLFHDRNATLLPAERALMHDILRTLIGDVERSVRKALSVHLADHPDVPPDVARALASDDIEVAHPMLVESPVLRDPALIEIVHHRTLQHRLAVAMRAGLSEAVSDALVESGETEVLTCLIENSDARIAAGTMERLVEASRDCEALQPPLVQRRDLGPDLARRLSIWVSAALRNHLVETYRLDARVVDDAVERAVLGREPARAAAAPDGGRAHQLTARIVDHLRRGEIPQFEAAMVCVAGLRPALMRRILYDPGGEGLAVVCRGCGIAKADFASIFLLCRKARPAREVVQPDEIARALAFYDSLDAEGADRVMARWRRDETYLSALTAVER